jgi:hypothetical protein
MKTIAIVIITLITWQVIQADNMICPPLKREVIAQVQKLHYSDSEKDIDNLKQLVELLQNNVYGCIVSRYCELR